jgi:hypothetical protein
VSCALFIGVEQSFAPGITRAQTPLKHAEVIKKLVHCESRGKSVKIVDVNGYYSYGILQFQSSTWNEWSVKSGIVGNPMVKEDAMFMADWAIDQGYIYHWSCAHKLNLIASR